MRTLMPTPEDESWLKPEDHADLANGVISPLGLVLRARFRALHAAQEAEGVERVSIEKINEEIRKLRD